MIRRLVVSALLLVALVASVPAYAQEGDDPGKIVVAEVTGPLDQRTLDYLEDAVEASDAQLIILQIDAPGIASGDPLALYEAVTGADFPVAVWVGPDGAVAFGGAAFLMSLVDIAGAAPGAAIGWLEPIVAGESPTGLDMASSLGLDESLVTAPIATVADVTEDGLEIEGDIGGESTTLEADGLVSIISPSIGQFIAALDGATIDGVTLETTETTFADDGTEIIVPSVFVEFRKPGLFTRFLRLGIWPEATFFFLAAGIALMAFEFYAAGAGITAAVSVLALFLAGYGLATLPMNWVAVVAVLVGMWMYTWEFQRNQLGIRSVVGTVLLLGGGFTLTTAGPQFEPRWWAVILVVAGIALFYVFAMGTVVRSRFSTPTLGREYLIGARGVAESTFDPEGTVTIDGARWRARSHRAAGLQPGDEVEVIEVKGIMLEVGPPEASPRN
jgi:membrane-bound serine protease (ClpP class)